MSQQLQRAIRALCSVSTPEEYVREYGYDAGCHYADGINAAIRICQEIDPEPNLSELLAACVAMIHRDPHDLNDSRPCETCRVLRSAMIAAARELGVTTCWCADKTMADKRAEWKHAAHFPGCPRGA